MRVRRGLDGTAVEWALRTIVCWIVGEVSIMMAIWSMKREWVRWRWT